MLTVQELYLRRGKCQEQSFVTAVLGSDPRFCDSDFSAPNSFGEASIAQRIAESDA